MSLAREPDTTPTTPTTKTRGRVEPDIDPASTPVPGRTYPAPPGVVRSLALALQRTAGNGAATALVKGSGPTVQRADIVEEPRYVQSGVLRGEKTDGGLKNAEFDFKAKFTPMPKGADRHPLEVRQDIRWDEEYEETAGSAPPHFGGAAAGDWHEDRFPDTDAEGDRPAAPGTRYGHRDGPYANQFQELEGDFDKYVEAGHGSTSERLLGEQYDGSDSPKVLPGSQGKFDFRLRAVDTSKGGQVVATSETLTVDWNDDATAPLPTGATGAAPRFAGSPLVADVADGPSWERDPRG
ncbi:hypothetical protein F4560_004518 [Saccharothrix ecbatanensis]|uniref:Uncharacterized protein n=1 Tax=Saccharothrix ecbatanensis TaxID=1105145 RepID=A0A7W9HM40_9PSEU|nr:hypothetical protein [Saccharothrix ecbatanensis]MBB5804750.1 hypothetical protein [Saccharothrix ecbatanensis]